MLVCLRVLLEATPRNFTQVVVTKAMGNNLIYSRPAVLGIPFRLHDGIIEALFYECNLSSIQTFVFFL